MGKWSVTKDDVARGSLVKPGWHELEIIKFEEKPAKDKMSMNALFHFRVTGGENAGAVILHSFSEKAPGFMVPLLEALGAAKNAEGGFDVDLSDATLKGKKVQGNVIRGEWEGKANNKLTEFRPV